MNQPDSTAGKAIEFDKGALPTFAAKHEPDGSDSMNYYQEFCKLYLANLILNAQLKELNGERQDLLTRLSKVEVGIPLFSVRTKKEWNYPARTSKRRSE